MRLTFLGTGTSTGIPLLGCGCEVCRSPDPRDCRTRPSLLVEFDGHAVVIDTSPEFRIQALREKMGRLDAVLFTHAHADHILGLDDVRGFCFRQRTPIPIYANAQCMASIQRVFAYIFDGDYPYGGLAKLAPNVIDKAFPLWGLTFTPVPVFHGSLPILGFRFGKAAYVTDFSAIPDSSLALLEGLEVLVLAALRHKPHPAHSTVEQSLAVVERLQPRQTYFTHIAHELGHQQTGRLLPPHVKLAYDGLRVEL